MSCSFISELVLLSRILFHQHTSMFSIVNRSPRRCKALPPTATTNRCFLPLAGPLDEGVDADEEEDSPSEVVVVVEKLLPTTEAHEAR